MFIYIQVIYSYKSWVYMSIHVCKLYMYLVPTQTRRGHWSSWHWSYRTLWAGTWGSRNENGLRKGRNCSCWVVLSAPFWLSVHNSSLINNATSKYTPCVWPWQEQCHLYRPEKGKHRALPPVFTPLWIKEENWGKEEKLEPGRSFMRRYNSISFSPL